MANAPDRKLFQENIYPSAFLTIFRSVSRTCVFPSKVSSLKIVLVLRSKFRAEFRDDVANDKVRVRLQKFLHPAAINGGQTSIQVARDVR